MLLGVFVLSGGSIFSRLADQPPIWIACLRCVLAVAILALFGLRHPKIPLSVHDRKLSVVAGLFLAIHLASWIASLGMTSVATSLLFVSTSPIWALLFGVILSLERGTILRWSACLIAFCGAAGLAFQQSGTQRASQLGLFLALISGITMGAYMLCGRAREDQDNTESYVLAVYAMAAVSLLLASMVTGQMRLNMPPMSWGWIALMAVCSQVVGHTTVNWAVPRLGASSVGIALLMEPVFASGMAWAAFHEGISTATLVSGATIAVGVVLVLREPAPPELSGAENGTRT